MKKKIIIVCALCVLISVSFVLARHYFHDQSTFLTAAGNCLTCDNCDIGTPCSDTKYGTIDLSKPSYHNTIILTGARVPTKTGSSCGNCGGSDLHDDKRTDSYTNCLPGYHYNCSQCCTHVMYRHGTSGSSGTVSLIDRVPYNVNLGTESASCPGTPYPCEVGSIDLEECCTTCCSACDINITAWPDASSGSWFAGYLLCSASAECGVSASIGVEHRIYNQYTVYQFPGSKCNFDRVPVRNVSCQTESPTWDRSCINNPSGGSPYPATAPSGNRSGHLGSWQWQVIRTYRACPQTSGSWTDSYGDDDCCGDNPSTP